MNLDQIVVESLYQSAVQVFSTMLGVTLERGESTKETVTPEANDQVVSLIGLAGTWAGTGSLSFSPLLACRACSQMLMTEVAAVNEEVLDAIAELTNMIVGNVKTDLERHVGPLGLSIPTVIYGRNFRTKNAGSAEWLVVRLHWDGEEIMARVCLAQRDRAGFQAPVPACALEV
jgi:chemotaxis protein CheX